MKRMNDIFELPVSSNDGNHMYETGSRWHVSQFYGAEKAQHAAHAINHVDALADALAVAAELLGAAHAECIENERAYHQALAALAAYWGEK
jgi:hypothetical protein